MKTKISYFLLVFCLSFPMLSFSENASLKGGNVKDKFEIQIKMLNGKNLPEYIKGVQLTDEGLKYLLITVVNKMEGAIYFKLKISSKNNPSVRLTLPISLLPGSFQEKIPVYYLHYIGGPMMVVTEEQTEFEWEIQDFFIR